MTSKQRSDKNPDRETPAPRAARRLLMPLVLWRERLKLARNEPKLPRYSIREVFDRIKSDWRDPRRWIGAAIFLFLALILFWQSTIYWSAVIDDAYISFRFSDVLARGHGLRFNLVDDPVEGFTNFLWTVILALPILFGWDVMLWAKLLGFACAIGTMAAACALSAHLRGRRDFLNLLPAALLAFNATFSHWALMGLETSCAVFLIALTYVRFLIEMKDRRAWSISPWTATLAAMTRIDSLFFLTPLGVYGIALVLGARMPLRRLVRWALIAAFSFGLFYGWRTWYFGDLLPNTYYAKQRLVNEQEATETIFGLSKRLRGKAHLFQFYLNPNGKDNLRPERLPVNTGPWERRLFSLGWLLRGGEIHGLMWIAWWSVSLLLILALPRPPTALLLLAPIALNAYYVFHVNGDWMPNFRFLQTSLPFLAVAGPVAIGLLQDVAAPSERRSRAPLVAAIGLGAFGALLVAVGLFQRSGSFDRLDSIESTAFVRTLAQRLKVFPFLPTSLPFFAAAGAIALALAARTPSLFGRWALAPVCAFFGLALAGLNLEQLRIESAYIFGPDPIWATRQPRWWTPTTVRRNLGRGFMPPLTPISDWLLLNTPDGATVFTSDFGQPMWYSTHLHHLDVEGLTDKHLAHAPSVRDDGDIPSRRALRQRAIAEFFPLGVLSARDERQVRAQTDRKDFEAHLIRNTDYILARRKPEYLILFIQTPTGQPTETGMVYPAISDRIHKDPRRARDYDVAHTFSKVPGVYNWIYRRKDADAAPVSDAVKLERLRRALDRNPRFHYLVGLIWEESRKMTDETARSRARVLVEESLPLVAGDWWVVQSLSNQLHSHGAIDLAVKLLDLAVERMPNEPLIWRRRADMANLAADPVKAVDSILEAARRAPRDDNEFHFVATYILEQHGRLERAIEIARDAVRRKPADRRLWDRLNAMAERAAARPNIDASERLKFKRIRLEALEGQRANGLLPLTPQVLQTIEQLKAELDGAR
jgi:tetratricopeptide (TPR) repeat protein